MKIIKYKDREYINFTEQQHINKHTIKENTHNFKCLWCNFSKYEVNKILKKVV